MRVTDKCKKFLYQVDGERIRIYGVVKGYKSCLVKHNCIGDKHTEHTIIISDVKANVKGEIGYIKKEIELNDGKVFKDVAKGDSIEFDAKICLYRDNGLSISYPTKLKINRQQ